MELGVTGKDMMLGEQAVLIPSPRAGDVEVLSPLSSALCSVAKEEPVPQRGDWQTRKSKNAFTTEDPPRCPKPVVLRKSC